MQTEVYSGRGLIHTCRLTVEEKAAIRANKDLRKEQTKVLSLDELLSRIEERINIPEYLFDSFVVKGVYYDFRQFMCSVTFKSYEIGKAEYNFSPIGLIPEDQWSDYLKKLVTSFVDFNSKV